MNDEPAISVIIPTHNRSTSLRRTLDALRAQTYPLHQVEVIVVADGCTDETVEMLQRYEAPFTLRTIEQSCQGAAAARNQGAARATGQLLLFLDDDVEPTPPLIETHVLAHQHGSGRVVIGAYPPALQGQVDFIRIELRAWWEAKFYAMRQPGHRYTYRDLLGGNLSLEAELFARVGGFDPTFPSCGGEDYELGVRLIKAAVCFTFASDALAYHHETSDLERSFRRSRQEGYADVLIGHRHPELRATLRLAHFEAPCLPLRRLLRTLAFRQPTAGDALVTWICPVLDLLEQARMRGRWRRLCRQLRDYWYWLGVAETLGTRRALASFLQGGPVRTDEGAHEIELNLREGLEAAERRLDEERPAAVRIRCGQQPVGRIPPQPGAERLRGVHLRPILATDLAAPLLVALAMEGTINPAIEAGQLLTARSMQPPGGTRTPQEFSREPLDLRGSLWKEISYGIEGA
jgi:glycosyltransferase involved in cell wall biosynthesis